MLRLWMQVKIPTEWSDCYANRLNNRLHMFGSRNQQHENLKLYDKYLMRPSAYTKQHLLSTQLSIQRLHLLLSSRWHRSPMLDMQQSLLRLQFRQPVQAIHQCRYHQVQFFRFQRM